MAPRKGIRGARGPAGAGDVGAALGASSPPGQLCRASAWACVPLCLRVSSDGATSVPQPSLRPGERALRVLAGWAEGTFMSRRMPRAAGSQEVPRALCPGQGTRPPAVPRGSPTSPQEMLESSGLVTVDEVLPA